MSHKSDMNILVNLVNEVELLKKYLSRSGIYSICRSDGRNLDLSEIMIIGHIFEKIDELLEKYQKNTGDSDL